MCARDGVFGANELLLCVHVMEVFGANELLLCMVPKGYSIYDMTDSSYVYSHHFKHLTCTHM